MHKCRIFFILFVAGLLLMVRVLHVPTGEQQHYRNNFSISAGCVNRHLHCIIHGAIGHRRNGSVGGDGNVNLQTLSIEGKWPSDVAVCLKLRDFVGCIYTVSVQV